MKPKKLKKLRIKVALMVLNGILSNPKARVSSNSNLYKDYVRESNKMADVFIENIKR